MPKAILFDGYGTLISTGKGSVQAAESILRNVGRQDMDPAAFYARWKQYHRQHMDGLKDFVTEEEIFRMDLRALYREFAIQGDPDIHVQPMLDTLGNRTAFPESREVLERLASRYTLCIASTTDTAPLLRDMERNDLRVHRIFTSQSLRAYKPQPIFYQTILRELALKPEEVLFVGDSLTDDVQGPRAVGIPTCWVNRKGGETPPQIHPDHVVCDLRELLNFLE